MSGSEPIKAAKLIELLLSCDKDALVYFQEQYQDEPTPHGYPATGLLDCGQTVTITDENRD